MNHPENQWWLKKPPLMTGKKKKDSMDYVKPFEGAGRGNVSISKGGLSGSWFGIVVIIFVFYYFLKKASSDETGDPDASGTGTSTGGAAALINVIKQKYDSFRQQGYEPSHYLQIAQSLHDELLAPWNTDEDNVLADLMPLDDIQLQIVYAEFGLAKKNGLASQFLTTPQDLIYWLRDTMGGHESQLSEIFSRTGGILNY